MQLILFEMPAMFHYDLPRLSAILLTFFIAGTVKGVTGMGLPTIAMGLLGITMPPVAAATLLILPSFVTNLWQLLAGPGFVALARRLWTMMAGIAVGTIAGVWLMTNDSGGWTAIALGVVLVIYALFGLAARQLSVPAQAERPASPLVGLMTGLITGGTGVFVIPAVPYIQALGLDKEDLVQALGLSFTVSTIALAIGLQRQGAFELGDIGTSSLAVLPALLGMWLGQHVRRRVSPATFRRWFFICLIVLGLQLVLRPII
ncbi:sulfite exporter TauE/SafE family protein [Collimonas fungivorans]|uniref:sulfite exporter TauE/SafE family protein n=1 Tax=Collimonas fungivorans TaxID=158899 RepID=UPI003FA36D56